MRFGPRFRKITTTPPFVPIGGFCRFRMKSSRMKMPRLLPGKRHTQPRPPGSADALLLARLIRDEHKAGRITAVVTANAADARRLRDELPFFDPELRVTLFPDWETLPYDNFSPHQDLISERLATLWAIRQQQADVVLIPATTVLYRLPPPSFLAAYTFDFRQGQTLDADALKHQLTLAGYTHVTQVISPGEYTVRGGLIDLFPMGSAQPFRVDLFDDQIDAIRAFDPDSQRSLYPVPEVRLLPGHEFPMDEDARQQFRSRWRELLPGDPTKSRIYKDMGNGLATAGIEYYLPLFFEQTVSVFDYLGTQATLVLHGELEPAFARFAHDTRERYRLLASDPNWPVLPPEALFLSAEDFYLAAKALPQLALRTPGADAEATEWAQPLPDLTVNRKAEDPLQRLAAHLASSRRRTLLLADSEGRRESLLDFLRASRLAPVPFESLQAFVDSSEPLGMATGSLARGFTWHEAGLDLVTETELFATPPATRRRRRQEQTSNVDAMIRDLAELKVGDPVVHAEHGVGRYLGLVNLDLGATNPDGSPAPRNSCIWSTPRKPSSTCRCPSCT